MPRAGKSTSRKAPGARSSRGSTGGPIWETRRAGLKGMEIKSNREEISASRRKEVYRTDVEFANIPGEIRTKPRSAPDWPEKVAQIKEMTEAGIAQYPIAIALDIGPHLVQAVIKENGFVKGAKQ